jgi:hypothetical protein
MNKLTQQEIVEMRLKRYGQINNLWAMNNGIWRLSHVILLLRDKGLKIDGEYLPNADGGQSKIYNYKLITK